VNYNSKIILKNKMVNKCVFVTLTVVLAFGFVFGSTNSVQGYTTAEKDAIKELRSLASKHLYQDYMKKDVYLIRWLRDRKLDVNKANEKLVKSLEWRKANKIDTILSENNPVTEKMAKVLPFEHHGYDVDGRPVIIQEYSNWDLRKLAVAGEQAASKRHFTKVMEAASQLVRSIGERNPNVTQWILIGNMMTYNLRQHGCLSCVPMLMDFIRVYEANYPDNIKNIIVINAPRIMDAFLSLLRPIMSPATRDQFRVHTQDKKEWKFIGELIPKKELIPRLGGTRKKPTFGPFPS